jgi:hypothetical protein
MSSEPPSPKSVQAFFAVDRTWMTPTLALTQERLLHGMSKHNWMPPRSQLAQCRWGFSKQLESQFRTHPKSRQEQSQYSSVSQHSDVYKIIQSKQVIPILSNAFTNSHRDVRLAVRPYK